jgi:hypothetical protein
MRGRPLALVPLLLVPAAMLIAEGCSAILDSTGYYEVQPSADASPPLDATCVPGTDRRTLEHACTNAECLPYASVLPVCDGGLCPLPVAVAGSDGGSAVPSAEASADDGEAVEGDGAAVEGDGAASGGGDSGGDAGLATSCSRVVADPTTIVYVTGSTALASFIGEVSSAISSQVTIVYQQSGSCVGVRSAIDPTDNVLSSVNGAATYYTPDGTQHTCTLDPADGLTADIGASDVFYSTCYLDQATTPMLPAGVGENFGPVQVMNFAVPQASPQDSISLAAAYYIFGFGGVTYPIAPWTDPTQLQIRSANSGTQALIAAAIGVPPAQWKGVGHGTSQEVGAALIAAGQTGNPQIATSALGILASDYLLQNTQVLSGLAVQDENSTCSYYPNSTAFARDNANVRDGHYPLWGPSHFYARVDPSTNLPRKAGVAKFIDGLNGVTPVAGLDLVAEYASKGLVPQCAMHVTRSSDGGDYSPVKPSVTCNCYFDLHATGATECRSCNANGDCPGSAPNCNKFGPQPQQGYCDL